MIKEYISSGILEIYIMGIATEDEARELLEMKAKHPEINIALQQLELDMEKIAGYMAVNPPPTTWSKIEQEINDVQQRYNTVPEKFAAPKGDEETAAANPFIEVEAASTHMRIHKAWQWVFAAVFLLGKIFLACAIYFYFENRQAQMQIKELKTQIIQLEK